MAARWHTLDPLAPVDSILRILIQEGADELRLGIGKAPRLLARGAAKRFHLPETNEEMMRHLLGDLLTTERQFALRHDGRVDFVYAAAKTGTFKVTLVARAGEPDALAATFLLQGPVAAVPTPAPSESSPHAVRESRRSSAPPPSRSSDMPPSSPSGIHRASVPLPAAAATSSPSSYPAPPSAPGASGLRALLEEALALGASDLHLRDGEPPTARVDGRLTPLTAFASRASEPVDVSLLLGSVLDATARQRLAAGASADLATELPGTGRFRLNVYATDQGLAAAVRVLPGHPPSLADLRLPVPLRDLVAFPHGLVLVTGATGAGKSTTLAALAQEALRRRSIVLVTLEEPIEYALDPAGTESLVRQRQVGRDVRDFATGLRDALREDLDVLLVGEMRDPESISLALTAAETGHLVLASLHSRSATSAVERIVDAYPPERQLQVRIQLADALRVVVAQRLVPRARGRGRAPALEVLRATHAVASLIREGKTAQLHGVIQSSKKDGMIPLERCLAEMVRTGEITLDDARAAANDPAALTTFLGP